LEKNIANKYSDIWSLGVILYKMIYHKSPFKQSFGSFGEYKTTFEGHKKELQRVVDNILKKMICKDKRASWREVRT
jgi:serine/threonine protein kinase